MLWKILLAVACAYIFFIAAPAIVAGITIFKGRPGTGFDKLVSPGGTFCEFADIMCPARERLLALPRQNVSCTSTDGLTLTGEYWDLGKERTAIFFHGYRSDPMVNFAVEADIFATEGYNLLVVRQRGHEEGSRAASAMGLKEQFDVLSWNEWALSRAGVKQTVIYGMSMGGATIAYASDKLDPAVTEALIIDSGYISPYAQIYGDCKSRHLPGPLLMPVIRLFARLRYGIDIKQQTDASLKNAKVPCFFIHGTGDRTVPFKQGKQNFEACSARKALFTAEGADHTKAFLTEPARAEKEIFEFIRKPENKEEIQNE